MCHVSSQQYFPGGTTKGFAQSNRPSIAMGFNTLGNKSHDTSFIPPPTSQLNRMFTEHERPFWP